MSRRPDGSSLGTFNTAHHPAGEAIVVRVNPVTAEALGVTLARPRAAAASLEPWGLHFDGSPVWRLRDLRRVLGLPEPARHDRSARHGGERSRR
jgi:hypothetical protein